MCSLPLSPSLALSRARASSFDNIRYLHLVVESCPCHEPLRTCPESPVCVCMCVWVCVDGSRGAACCILRGLAAWLGGANMFRSRYRLNIRTCQKLRRICQTRRYLCCLSESGPSVHLSSALYTKRKISGTPYTREQLQPKAHFCSSTDLRSQRRPRANHAVELSNVFQLLEESGALRSRCCIRPPHCVPCAALSAT
jgi:hypothetical protein